MNLLFHAGTKKNKDHQDFSPAIVDADFVNSNYERLLSPDKIQVETSISFTETVIYRFLETYIICARQQTGVGRESRLEIDALLKAFYQRDSGIIMALRPGPEKITTIGRE